MKKLQRFFMMLCVMLLSATSLWAAKNPYTLTYDKAAELLKLTKEGCTSYETTYMGQATLEGYDGYFSFNPADPEWTLMGNTCIAAYVALPDGDYTLKVAAGTYLFDGVENEAFEIPFTIGEKQQGGGNTGDFDGEKWQETIFKAGETSVSVPVTFDTEGVAITTVGREFMGMTIDVAYNTYEENEIDWNNGTKLVVTAKDNISGIHMEGNFLQFASADKGTYSNGNWSGALMKGETLTLTANDGIHIHKLVVLYNGEEYQDGEGDINAEGAITIQYPTDGMPWATFNNGNKLATFTTNKEYAQVIIDVKDMEPGYDDGNYDFPTRMIDNNGEKSDNLHVGENTITALTPSGTPWNFFKGHTYKMTVRGYINMWDNEDAYDAIAEVTFVGNGTEAPAISDVTLNKIFPEHGATLPEGPRTIDLTFSAPVKTLKAIQPKGMEGSVNYTCTKVDEAGLHWNINLGSLSVVSEEGGQSSISLEITGTDKADAVLNLGSNAARALQLQYTISKTATEPEQELDVQIVPSFIYGEEEVALNDHSNVSVEGADALKVGFGDGAAAVRYATYAISEYAAEEFMGVVDTVEVDVATGVLNLNGFGYAEFENALLFNYGSKYNVTIKAWNSEDIFNEDFTIKEPVATFTCNFNGTYDPAGPTVVEIVPSFIYDEEEVTLNDHSNVSVEGADALKVGFGDNGSVVKYATYSINALVEEEFMGVVDTVEEEIASGALNLNGFGYAEFENALVFNYGSKYNMTIKAWNTEDIFNSDFTIKEPVGTFTCEFNGAYGADPINTIAAGKYAVTATVELDQQIPVDMVPAGFERYIGEYETNATLEGDTTSLVITENAEGGLFNGFVIKGDAVAYNPSLTITLGGKEFQVRGLDGSESGKLAITATEEGYEMEGAAIWYMGRQVATVTNVKIAKESDNQVWDFSEFKDRIILADDNKEIEYRGLTLVGSSQAGYTSDYVEAAGCFHMNGTSSATTRHIVYTPTMDGTVTVTYRSNNATATDRITAIGTEVVKGSDIDALLENEAVLAAGLTDGATQQTISANLKKGVTYYFYFANGGQSIMKIEYVPGEATSISNATAAVKTVNVKLIENGKLVIVKNGVKYNAAGQIVK